MPEPQITVVIPTLAADVTLLQALQSLETQTYRDFTLVIVDNSGDRLARKSEASRFGATILENTRNVGFGAAVNQGGRATGTRYLATLNDDAVAHPQWLEELVGAIEPRPDVGMCASQVRLAGRNCLDSAGMLMCADGTSKQRGHLEAPEKYARAEEVLLPSASAALYRREMLEQIGWFDEDFFLYSEDTDVGLRARWAGWKCLYVPGAVVDHLYSYSAGRASPLKAYYVERNRLFVISKNFPMRALMKAPLSALARYWWHLASIFQGRGSAAQFRMEGNSSVKLTVFVLQAHGRLLLELGRLWRKRRAIRRHARISAREFCTLLRTHSISPREVAAL